MRILTIISYLVLAVFGVVFATLNAQPALVNLYFKTVSFPISVWVLLSFSIGLLFGLLLSLPRYFAVKYQLMMQKHALTASTKKIQTVNESNLT